MVYILAWALVGGTVGYLVGTTKGREGEGFVLGAFLGIIGWLLVLAGPDYRRHCPHCLAAVPDPAAACRHCGRSLEPVAAPRPMPPPPAPLSSPVFSSTQRLPAPAPVYIPQRTPCPCCHVTIQHPPGTGWIECPQCGGRAWVGPTDQAAAV